MGQAEYKGHLSEDDFLTIVDFFPRVAMLIDREGIIVYWNKKGTAVFGYQPEEIVGESVRVLYPKRDEDEFNNALRVLQSEGQDSFETEGLQKNGSRIWLNIRRAMIETSRGEPLILETANDISEKKKAETELSRRQARTETILETAVEGIITINRQGIIESFNKAAEEMFGYDAEEVIGRNVNMLMPSPYHEEHDQYMFNYHTTGERKIIGIGREVRAKRKDGTVFPIELAVNEVEFQGETFYTGLFKDISDKRKLENKILEIAEDERRRIGQELHDGLGQMLSGIGMISRNLARKFKANGLAGADEIMEISDMIKEADEHARRLAHGLAHIELDNEGLRVALSRLCERFERLSNIDCTFELPDKVNIEERQISLHLYRIAQEAITNAIKHGEATKIKIRLKSNSKYLLLFVDDNGRGYSTPKKQSGMGLNTMRYRAHILGGTLDLTDLSSGGTRLTCTIPFPNNEIIDNIQS